jgi:hypothetical protein
VVTSTSRAVAVMAPESKAPTQRSTPCKVIPQEAVQEEETGRRAQRVQPPSYLSYAIRNNIYNYNYNSNMPRRATPF